jgi:hypothetical protein
MVNTNVFVRFISTHDLLADIFTKRLTPARFLLEDDY